MEKGGFPYGPVPISSPRTKLQQARSSGAVDKEKTSPREEDKASLTQSADQVAGSRKSAFGARMAPQKKAIFFFFIHSKQKQ
jgi:hypothetical protein